MTWLDKQLKTYIEAKQEGDRLVEEEQFEEAHLKLQEALETLDRAYRREHDEVLGLLQKCWTAIVDKNLEQGDRYLEEENYAQAREHYQIALDLAQTKQQKDEIRIKLGQTGPERATTGLAKLFEEVEAHPDSPEAYYSFATELALEGYFNEAATYLEKLVELTPDDADAHLKLANALADCDRDEEAEKAYGKARDLGADSSEVDFRLGQIQIGRGDHSAARRCLMRALDKKTDYIDAHRSLAHLFAVDGDYEQAIAAFEKVLALDTEDSESYFELGNLHEIRGAMNLARENWQKAIDVEPDGDFAAFARDKLENTGIEERTV